MIKTQKNAQVSLVEGQKEAYKVPQEYGVAKFDPVRWIFTHFGILIL